MTKDTLRKRLLSVRRETDKLELEEKSRCIRDCFYEMFSMYECFLLYMPIKSEVDIFPLAEKFYSEGKRVYFPVVENGRMCFRLFEGIGRMEIGEFGIMEPRGSYLDRRFDVIGVPAVAFDRDCYRLGYGKGFYDRFLSCGEGYLRVGLAYNFQIVDSVCRKAHDEPVDIIVTENQIIRRIG